MHACVILILSMLGFTAPLVYSDWELLLYVRHTLALLEDSVGAPHHIVL